jgi:hypothetical protein
MLSFLRNTRPDRFGSRLGLTLLALGGGTACVGNIHPQGGASGGRTGATGGGTTAATGGKSAPGTGAGSGGTSAPTDTGGGPGSGGAGAPAGSGGSATGGTTAVVGTGGSDALGNRDHCLYGFDPDPTDSDPTMKDGPSDFYPPGNMSASIVDTTLQPQVLTWMQSHSWENAHVEWHAIRTCALPGGGSTSHVNICSFTSLIPKDQNCQDEGDGYQFLLFHRHMIQALKQLWPNHQEQFTGFPKFPQSAADVPPEWRSVWSDWDPQVLAAGLIGDAIDTPANLAKFPSEGVLGFWLQCNVGQVLSMPANSMPFVGLHFLLHAKWVRAGNTTHGVNNTNANIDNYMFWKLHGWIDNVWEKYRVAKGLKQTDAKYKADMLAQCREMDTEISIVQSNLKPTDVPPPLPKESGFFHEMVRPILESQTNKCDGCHDASGAETGLILGGNISSADIVAGLVNQQAIDGGQYKLVVPGDPDHSWLYLKITGNTGACTPTAQGQCITGPMPPDAMGALTVSASDAAIVRQWISDGAAGPPAVSN